MNVEFQRIARRDEKAFLSDQCEEIEENHRIGKSRELSKKIRDTKGIFDAKIHTIKNRNSMDLIDRVSDNYRWRFMTLRGGRDQDHPQEKEMQKSKMAV